MSLKKYVPVSLFAAGLLVGILSTAGAATMMGSVVFSDVQPGAYFDGAIGRLYSAGIVKGGADGKYHPTDFVTRADIAVMLDRALNGDAGTTVSRSSRSSSVRSSSSSDASSSVSSSSVSSSSSSVATIGAAGAFRFTSDHFSFPEGAASIILSVQRYGGTKGSSIVHFATADGTAKAGTRYNAATGDLAFGDGETSKNITLHFVNNLIADPNENFTITLSSPTGGAVVGTPGSTTVTILDNDGGGGNAAAASSSSSSLNSSAAAGAAGGTISFSAWAYAVDESAGTLAVTVIRKGNTSAAVTVDFATSAGSATTGINYTDTHGTLSFAAGETSKTFPVQVMHQTTIDGNKSLTMKLSNVTGGALIDSPSSVQLTVIDSEAGTVSATGSIMFSAATYTVSHNDTSALVTVYRRGSYSATATVKYATSDNSAVSGSNYTNTSGTLTFAVGESNKSFTIPLTPTTFAGQKNINLTLSAPTNSVLGSQASAQVQIMGQ